MGPASRSAAPRTLDRYVVLDEIAAGGMATVHLGRLLGPAGFSRTVALKCLFPQHARVPEFVSMFLDEARLASRVRHPNVVSVLDVVEDGDEFALVMEYIHGQSLARLTRGRESDAHPRATPKAALPTPVALAILADVLRGLHAAHEARGEDGSPLELVHRDVSPHNVLVGVDGVARVVDFGIAKAAGRLQTTRDGQLKGKLAYMAPEQLRGETVCRRTDVYAAGVLLWELLTGRRLFVGDNEAVIFGRVLEGRVDPPCALVPGLPPALDAIVLRAVRRDPEGRFATAIEMAVEIEAVGELASAAEIGAWVAAQGGSELAERGLRITEIERLSAPGDLEQMRSAVRRRTEAEATPVSAAQSDLEGSETVDADSAARALAGLKEATATDVSVTTPPPRPRARRLAWAGAAGAGVLAVVAVVSAPSWYAPRTPCLAGIAAALASTSAALPEPGSPTASPPETAAAAPPRREPTATAAAAARPRPAPRAVPSASTRPDAVQPGCDPPWTFDGSGTKRYKLECL